MAFVKCVLFAALCALAIAKIMEIEPCPEYPHDACTVIETRIEPCDGGKKCGIRKNRNVSMSFDFTPNFSTQNAKTMVYAFIGGQNKVFDGFGTDDACAYTSCPLESGKTQSLSYNMYLEKHTPRGSFNLQWRLWNVDNDQQICCFKMAIKIKN